MQRRGGRVAAVDAKDAAVEDGALRLSQQALRVRERSFPWSVSVSSRPGISGTADHDLQ